MATPVARFAAIGVVSTLAYALLFLLLAGAVGSAVASAVALALTAVANTAANRRFTFGIRGRDGLLRQHAAGFARVPARARAHERRAERPARSRPRTLRGCSRLAVLVLATLVATVTRYVALS